MQKLQNRAAPVFIYPNYDLDAASHLFKLLGWRYLHANSKCNELRWFTSLCTGWLQNISVLSCKFKRRETTFNLLRHCLANYVNDLAYRWQCLHQRLRTSSFRVITVSSKAIAASGPTSWGRRRRGSRWGAVWWSLGNSLWWWLGLDRCKRCL